jgi:hypothetical protein
MPMTVRRSKPSRVAGRFFFGVTEDTINEMHKGENRDD